MLALLRAQPPNETIAVDAGQEPVWGEPEQAPSQAPVARGPVFAIIAFALMMMSIDGTIVATALHALQEGLGTTVNWAAWTITAYSFGFVLMLPLSGKLSERWGNRRVFLASVVMFTVASLLCGLATNIYMLIACRVLQAAGGAGFTPSATGIIVHQFGSARDRAVSLFGSIFPVGAMIGPIFGGLFVTYWSWRGVFLVNLPIGIAVVALAWRFIPHDKPTALARRLDLPGLAWLGAGLMAGMFAISYLGEAHSTAASPLFLAPAVAAVVALALFIHHIRRSDHACIPPRLIYGSGFGPVNLVNVLLGGVPTGALVLVPLYAVNRYGLSALDSGTLLVAEGLAAVVLSTLAAWGIRRTGYRVPIAVGGLLLAAGLALLALAPPDGFSPYAWLACATFLMGVGVGFMSPASRNAGLQLAPQRSSILAALRSMGRQVGTISTISVVTAILAASATPAATQAGAYVVIALLVLATMPAVAGIHEHRGAW